MYFCVYIVGLVGFVECTNDEQLIVHTQQKTACFKMYTYNFKLIVKLREREGQRVDLGRSLKGHL